MRNPYRDNVDRFLGTIAPWVHAYTEAGFSYLAVRSGSGWTLLHGRLFLRTEPLAVSHENFVTERIIAGHEVGPASTDGFVELINSLFENGAFNLPIGALVLPRDAAGIVAAFYAPFHSEGLTGQKRLPVLTISGGSRHGLLDQPSMDWELKASATPFESMVELGGAYSLGGYSGDTTAIEIVAQPVVEIDVQSSVSGTRAEPALLLAAGLNKAHCRLGYRVLSNRKVVRRGSFDGGQLDWTSHGARGRGLGKLEVPQAAVLQCFASYSDVTQHYHWLSDPKNFQNPLRMALQSTDADLEVVRDYLFEERKGRKEARDFEHGVSMLAWMLGFGTAHCGATQRLSDAPDIVAATPKGDMVVVECTTGILKADNKIAKLTERSRAIRQSLDASGNSHVRVLPVIVTALEHGAVEGEIGPATSMGVCVVTKEALRNLLARTVGVPDSQAVFDQAWNSVRSGISGGVGAASFP